MDDETEAPSNPYPLSRPSAKMSKTPSWVMLGFLLGAVFVYALMRPDPSAQPPAVPLRLVEPPAPIRPREAAPLTTIEAVFAAWGEHAVWSGDTTEVALWNKTERRFADCFEVRRISGVHFFRSIPELTRRVIRHGRELPDSPLQFTETEEQYREWVEFGRTERRAENEVTPRPPPPRTTNPGGVITPSVPPPPRSAPRP